MRTTPMIIAALLLGACSSPSEPEMSAAAATGFTPALVPVAENLDMPWGLTFLPDGAMLVSERPGQIQLIRDGARHTVTGGPEALVAGQGGYLDIEIDPNFANNRFVYLAYSWGDEDATGTALWRARLSDDEARLEGGTQVFTSIGARSTALHFGGRIQFVNDGTLLLTLGEGFRYRDEAQNTANHLGSVVRLNTDGTLPADNPFAGDSGAAPGLFSYGHRNSQGLAYDAATDTIYEHEHGPKGGDEINILRAGANYGWPAITYGVDYDGTVISSDQEMDGMEQPITYWVPSIAPSGMAFISGDTYPGWGARSDGWRTWWTSRQQACPG